jgi:hypothetical protein
MGRGALEMIAWSSPTSDVMRRAYAHAIASGYRFYSYGDACLLFRTGSQSLIFYFLVLASNAVSTGCHCACCALTNALTPAGDNGST